MKRLVLGVVGHVDHGKTALVGALTGQDTDRLPEEKRRGISIALGFAHAVIGEGMVDFVDAPGHERFVRTLVGGVTGADAVLAVVAANEGVKPQTREHLTIAALLGVRTAIIVVTKCDVAEPEEIGRAGESARRVAAELGIEASAPIATSAVSGLGLDELRAAIAHVLNARAPIPEDGFPYLPVDRAFHVPGQGVVATGTLRRGVLRPEEPVELLPAGVAVRLRGLQVHGRPVTAAAPGQRVAANVRGVELDQAPRGAVLAGAGVLSASEWLTVSLRAASDAPTLANGAKLDLLIGAALIPVTVRLLESDQLEPGATALAQLRAQTPTAVPAREGFVLRTPSPAGTVAGGEVIDPVARRLRRREGAAFDRLRALAKAGAEERVRLALPGAGGGAISLVRLSQLSGLSPARVAEIVASDTVRLKAGLVVSRAALGEAQRRVLAILSEAGALSRQALVERAPALGGDVVDAALRALIAAGRARGIGGRFAIVREATDRAQAEAQKAIANRLNEALLAGGLSPPDVLGQGREPAARRALDALVKDGLAVRTYDRVQKREVLFHRQSVEVARQRLRERLTEPGLSVSEVGQLLGISRKYSVPLLEHLDAVGFTRRRGDRRVLAAALAPVTPTERGGD